MRNALCRAADEQRRALSSWAHSHYIVCIYFYRYTRELGRPIDADTEVSVGVGASECLYALMQVR